MRRLPNLPASWFWSEKWQISPTSFPERGHFLWTSKRDRNHDYFVLLQSALMEIIVRTQFFGGWYHSSRIYTQSHPHSVVWTGRTFQDSRMILAKMLSTHLKSVQSLNCIQLCNPSQTRVNMNRGWMRLLHQLRIQGALNVDSIPKFCTRVLMGKQGCNIIVPSGPGDFNSMYKWKRTNASTW